MPSPRLINWCHLLSADLTDRTGYKMRVSPKADAEALRVECAWDQTGKATLVTSIALPGSAERIAALFSPRRVAADVWAELGSFADFYHYWMDHQSEHQAPA